MTALKQAVFSVVRYIPNALREEFINVGVLLVAPDFGFQQMRALSSASSLRAKLSPFPMDDGTFVQAAVADLSSAINSRQLTGLIASAGAPDGQLTLNGLDMLIRSFGNNIRLTDARTALTSNPVRTLDELYEKFVPVAVLPEPLGGITITEMRNFVRGEFNRARLFQNYPERVRMNVRPLRWAGKIDFAYMSTTDRYYQLVSFDEPDRASEIIGHYLAVAVDLRKQASRPRQGGLMPAFAVLVQEASAPDDDGRIGAMRDRLQEAQIELLDYRRDAALLAARIKNELQESVGMGR